MGQSDQRRYSFEKEILTAENGTLFSGKDVSLSRDVLLYRNDKNENTTTDEYQRMLAGVSHLTDPRFLHILDIGKDEHGLFAVMEQREGSLLGKELDTHPLSFWETLEAVCVLGQGLQDAMEEHIRGFAVTANNLWITDRGELLVINYWADGERLQRGVSGLSRLLFQLLTKQTRIPTDLHHIETQLEKSMANIAKESRESVVRLILEACADNTSLSSFILHLGLLTKEHGTLADKRNENVSLDDLEQNDHPDTPNKRKRKYLLIAVGGLIILFLSLSWIGLQYLLDEPASTSSKIGKDQQQVAGSGGTQVQDDQKLSPAVQVSPSDSAGKSAVNTSQETAQVPQLVGLQREAAEKQALAAGLHYNYYMEPNKMPTGTVFKQDLEAGKTVAKETTINFWVSKGMN